MTREKGSKPRKKDAVIRLEDLAPRQDVKGGGGKRLFGERGAGDLERPPSDEGEGGHPAWPRRPAR